LGLTHLHQLLISLMMHEILNMLLLVFFKPPTLMIIGEITFVNIVKLLLAQFKLTHVVFAYVQNKGSSRFEQVISLCPFNHN
jgi:hypothetical protein